MCIFVSISSSLEGGSPVHMARKPVQILLEPSAKIFEMTHFCPEHVSAIITVLLLFSLFLSVSSLGRIDGVAFPNPDATFVKEMSVFF